MHVDCIKGGMCTQIPMFIIYLFMHSACNYISQLWISSRSTLQHHTINIFGYAALHAVIAMASFYKINLGCWCACWCDSIKSKHSIGCISSMYLEAMDRACICIGSKQFQYHVWQLPQQTSRESCFNCIAASPNISASFMNLMR